MSAPPNPVVTGWTVFGAASTASLPDPTQSGIGSLRLVAPGGFNVPVVLQTFSASPGQVWDLQGYMLSTSALPANATFGLLKIVFSDGTNDLPIGVSDVLIGQPGPVANPGVESLPFLDTGSPASTWIFTQARGIAPAGTTQVSLFALNVDQSAATMYFDDLQALSGYIDPVVTTLVDEDDGDANPANGAGTSLREAVNYAGFNSTITFDNAFDGQTITLTNGQLFVDKSLGIDASALGGGITVDGNNSSGIFEFEWATTNVLDNVTLTNGADIAGGAISCNGTLTLNNSTVSGNEALYEGGGIHSLGYFQAGLLVLTQSTVSDNSASQAGGIAIHTETHITNSIVVGNSGVPENISGISSGTNNLTNGVPLLAPLGDYGGLTETMPPLPGSPAIDAGGAPFLPTDQRGAPRPKGPLPDIGSVEAVAFSTLGLEDTEPDGIPDVLEGTNGPYSHLTVGVDDSAVDTDGDGSTDAEEIFNMTDLFDPDDSFRIIGFDFAVDYDPVTNQSFEITWRTFPGFFYLVDFPDDLVTPAGIQGYFIAEDSTHSLTVPLPDLGSDVIFVRTENVGSGTE